VIKGGTVVPIAGGGVVDGKDGVGVVTAEDEDPPTPPTPPTAPRGPTKTARKLCFFVPPRAPRLWAGLLALRGGGEGGVGEGGDSDVMDLVEKVENLKSQTPLRSEKIRRMPYLRRSFSVKEPHN